jgi:hypothetical protein
MRKVFYLSAVVLILSFAKATSGGCWPWDKKSPPPAMQPPAQAAVQKTGVPAASTVSASQGVRPPSKAELDKMRATREKKRGELNNTQWELTVKPLSGKGKEQKNTLIFQDHMFSSEEFLKKGFQPSNYTLTVLDNGVVVVETMQTSEKEGLIFWRVEFDEPLTTCKGVFSRQLPHSKSEDFSLRSISRKLVPLQGVSPVIVAASTPLSASTPASQGTKTEPGKENKQKKEKK